MRYPDGYTLPQNNPYNPYANQYAPIDSGHYNAPSNYGYTMASKNSYYESKVADNIASTPYTPAQYCSQQMGNPQTCNPYYSGSSQDTNTAVTDSPNPAYNQSNPTSLPNQYNEMYAHQQVVPTPEAAHASFTPHNQAELANSFGQMQLSTPKPEPPSGYGNEYAHTFYSVQYPQVSTPNNATYSHAIQNSNTSVVTSQLPADYNTLNYPYGNVDQAVPSNPSYVPTNNPPATNTYAPPEAYGYASTSSGFENQVYPIYTNPDSASTYSTSTVSSNLSAHTPGYSYPEPDRMTAAALDAIDKPIKSHVTGQALSSGYYPTGIPQYSASGTNYSNPTGESVPQASPYPQNDQNVNYAQVYQNHPGYTFNATSGGYDYSYGSQNTISSYNNPQQQGNLDYVPTKDQHCPGQVYTSAGVCQTLQSPSETPQMVPNAMDQNNQMYYTSPYGYQTVQNSDALPSNQSVPTNYGANMNQSTYMQSSQVQDSSVTYSNNQGK